MPVADPIALLKLLQLDLQGQPPAAPVAKVALEAEPARPRVQQHGLFQPVSPEPLKMELTIARIAAFVGAGNIGTPQMEDTHRPDAFQMGSFGNFKGAASGTPVETVPSPHGTASPTAALRRFRPPRLPQVQLSAAGRPARIPVAIHSGRGERFFRTLAHFRRLVDRRPVGSRRMGCRSFHRRLAPHLLRQAHRPLVSRRQL